MTPPQSATASARDFASGQEVRWCPGCGDYAILKAVRQVLADVGAETHRTAFVSGIGCAARFPYYMSTFGFHTIHGRAPAVATGLKSVQPDLDVWVVTGDGDGMSIGAGHLFHVLRRNVDLQILLCNNQIYGLTKGQFSPTTKRGVLTPSTPRGAPDTPAEPCRFALGSGARFVARVVDVHQEHLRQTLAAARAFRGTALVEILQNCPIYNDGTFANLSSKATSPDHAVVLEHGKPIVFGRNADHGFRLAPGSLRPEVVTFDPEASGATEDLLVHDETDPTLATLLAGFANPDFPVPLGILYRNPAPQVPHTPHRSDSAPPEARLQAVSDMLRKGRTWRVE